MDSELEKKAENTGLNTEYSLSVAHHHLHQGTLMLEGNTPAQSVY